MSRGPDDSAARCAIWGSTETSSAPRRWDMRLELDIRNISRPNLRDAKLRRCELDRNQASDDVARTNEVCVKAGAGRLGDALFALSGTSLSEGASASSCGVLEGSAFPVASSCTGDDMSYTERSDRRVEARECICALFSLCLNDVCWTAIGHGVAYTHPGASAAQHSDRYLPSPRKDGARA